MQEQRKLNYLREMIVRRVEALAMAASREAGSDTVNAQFVGKASALYEVLEMIDGLKESDGE